MTHAPLSSPPLATDLGPPYVPTADEWAQLRVREIDIVRLEPADAPRIAVVRACVQIGRILPSEVRVDLRGAVGTEPRVATVRPRRMWSVQSHDAGCYGFEARIPDAELERADQLTVSAWSRRAAGEESEPTAPPISQLTVPLAKFTSVGSSPTPPSQRTDRRAAR